MAKLGPVRTARVIETEKGSGRIPDRQSAQRNPYLDSGRANATVLSDTVGKAVAQVQRGGLS